MSEEIAIGRKELSRRIGVKIPTLAAWRQTWTPEGCCMGPRFIKCGPGRACSVIYKVADVQQWLESRSAELAALS